MKALGPDAHRLLDGPNFASLALTRADGRPYVVVLWCGRDGEHVLVNSVIGRGWPAILDENPVAAVAVTNAENPYEYVQITGRVASRTLEDGEDVIDAFAQKYIGEASYPFRRPGEQRVTYRIEAEEVRHWKPYTG